MITVSEHKLILTVMMSQLYFVLFQKPYVLVNMTYTMLCNSGGISPDAVKGKAVVVMRGDCDFSQKAIVAQSLGATALLIASNTTLVRDLCPPVASISLFIVCICLKPIISYISALTLQCRCIRK